MTLVQQSMCNNTFYGEDGIKFSSSSWSFVGVHEILSNVKIFLEVVQSMTCLKKRGEDKAHLKLITITK